jgi:hypothetical protein
MNITTCDVCGRQAMEPTLDLLMRVSATAETHVHFCDKCAVGWTLVKLRAALVSGLNSCAAGAVKAEKRVTAAKEISKEMLL